MNNNYIGDLGESKVLSKFIEMGYDVYLPFSGHSAIDMIVDIGGMLLKIQVKSSTSTENGCTKFQTGKFIRKNANSSGSKISYSDKEIDYFALYSVKVDEVYLVHVTECTHAGIWIRYDMNVRKSSTINNASDYLLEAVVKRIIDN